MSEVLSAVKTNFTSGLLGENLYGRGDLNLYDNGARKLENVIIHPTGGISRRKGLKKIYAFDDKVKLVPFEFNTEQTYMLCFSEYKISVFKNDNKIAEISAPWNEDQIFEIKYTQTADTLLVLHPDIEPQKITRNANEVWKIEPWVFYTKDNLYCCPYYNFGEGNISLTVGATSGNTTATTDKDYFDAAHVGSRLRIQNGCAIITEVVSSKKVNITVEKNFSGTSATKDWEESAFSVYRGWPVCASFHQDRLVLGGSKSLPNHIWMSQSSDFFNFDYGTGLANEAIDFALLADQVNAIRAVISSHNLIIFTSGAEWVVKGDNLTPETTVVLRQTTEGIYGKYAVYPVSADGSLIFVSQNGKKVMQFLYNELEDAYQATNLNMLCGDIIENPQDVTFSSAENVVYFVLNSGEIACLTTYRAEQVKAWSKISTQGQFISVSSLEDEIYFIVFRNGKYYLECFSEECYLDCFRTITSETPTNVFGDLEDFEDMTVGVIAGDNYLGEYEVTDGSITLTEGMYDEISVGLLYEHIIEPLPFVVPMQLPISPRSFRIITAIFRIVNCKSLCVNLHKKYVPVPLNRILKVYKLDSLPESYSGDVELHSLGWIRNIQQPMWSIKDSFPAQFTLLSTFMKVKIK